MTNPFVHAIAFAAAVIIPGGLLVYFAWRAISLKGQPNHTAQKEGFEDNSEAEPPLPDAALAAFLEAFPKYSKDSLRAKSRANRMRIARTRPKKKSQ